jgi:hypothetical protein
MWYFSGKLSQMIKFICYAVLGGMMVLRRDNAHRVKIYHGQAYIDCDVDGDNNKNTCLSDFTVVSSFRFNAGYVLGTAFCIAAIMSLVELARHKTHMYSTFYYYDAIIVNSLLTFCIAVICGTQELSTLILLSLTTFVYEAGIYIHDIGYWKSETYSSYDHWGRISVLIFLNIITWSIIITGLVEYWNKSDLPIFISILGIVGAIHMMMLRIFHYRYFYGTLPAKIEDVNDKESQKLFDNEPYNSKSSQTKYETVVKVSPYVIEWNDHWKNVINITFRLIIGIVFYIGTDEIIITYQ